jgi:hypothetical protein
LSTPAVHTEAYLGQCNLLEPYMRKRRSIDLRLRRAAAARDEALALQEAQEVERLRARLAQHPPLLDPPFEHGPPANSASDGEEFPPAPVEQ